MQDRVPLQVRQHTVPLLGRPSMTGNPSERIMLALTDEQRARLGTQAYAIELDRLQVGYVRTSYAAMQQHRSEQAAQSPRQSKDGEHSPERTLVDGVMIRRCICGWTPKGAMTVDMLLLDIHTHIDLMDARSGVRGLGATNTVEARIVQAQRQHDVQMEALNKLNAQIGELAKSIGDEFAKALTPTNADLIRWLAAAPVSDEQRTAAMQARSKAWNQHVTDTTMSGNARSMGSFFAGWAAARRWLGR